LLGTNILTRHPFESTERRILNVRSDGTDLWKSVRIILSLTPTPSLKKASYWKITCF
jgi:hypothetical protein